MSLPDELNVRFWKVPASNKFDFPEETDPDLKYQTIVSRLTKKRCGIAFSGGGTVSAALAPGFIKALVDMGVMENVSYISGVSGGTWGTAAYCYAQSPDAQKAYYGGVLPPSEITIDTVPPDGSMIKANTQAPIARLSLENFAALKRHNSFTDAVGEIFLKPFGLHFKDTKYFTTDAAARAKILTRNPHLKDSQFILLADESPYYIMNGTLLTPPQSITVKIEEQDGNKKKLVPTAATFDGTFTDYPFEFTPLYCGIKGNQGADTTGQVLGGAYAESFGTDTAIKEEEQGNDYVTVTKQNPSKPFNLSAPVGTSGSAVEQLITENSDFLSKALPAFNYWNPNDKKLLTQQYYFGDGGISENTGVAALLARKIDNIVLFITEPFDLTPVSHRKCEASQRSFGHNQMAKLFGAPVAKKGVEDPYYDATTQFFNTDDFLKQGGLRDQLVAKKAKLEPVIVTGTYDVLQNKHFGIEGGWQATITWVIVDTCKEFNDKIDPSLKNNDGSLIKEIDNFPVICTFGQNKKHLIQLTNPQANLLASQAYWMASNSPDVKATLSVPSKKK